MPSLWEKPPSESNGCMPSSHLGRSTKNNLLLPLQNVPLTTSDNKQCKTLDVEPSQQPGSKKLRTTSQKAGSICMGHFHNCHDFQQQLIEKQKKKLQEQEKIILELKESQRLAEARWAAEGARTVADTHSYLLANHREEEKPKGTCQVLPKYVHSTRALSGLRAWWLHFVVVRLLNFSAWLPDSLISPFLLLCTLKTSKSPML